MKLTTVFKQQREGIQGALQLFCILRIGKDINLLKDKWQTDSS